MWMNKCLQTFLSMLLFFPGVHNIGATRHKLMYECKEDVCWVGGIGRPCWPQVIKTEVHIRSLLSTPTLTYARYQFASPSPTTTISLLCINLLILGHTFFHPWFPELYYRESHLVTIIMVVVFFLTLSTLFYCSKEGYFIIFISHQNMDDIQYYVAFRHTS